LKIGATLHIYNFRMRERRKELGLTQLDLAQMVGYKSYGPISRVESLKPLDGRLWLTREKLHKIADALELPFEEIFPDDYLQAIEKKVLRRFDPNNRWFNWIIEVNLLTLPPTEQSLMLPSAEKIFERNTRQEDLSQELKRGLNLLEKRRGGARMRKLLELRFGLLDNDPQTLEEVAAIFDVTRERIRQMELHALRCLRHPGKSRPLREFLIND